MKENNKIQFLDFRTKEAFIHEHIVGSVFIGQQGLSSRWLLNINMDLSKPIRIIVEDDYQLDKTLIHLGFDQSVQFLEGDLNTWKNAGHLTESLGVIKLDEFASDFNADCMISLDVRSENEFQNEHIIGVRNFPLNKISSSLGRLDIHTKYYLHSNDGYRAVVTASLLKLKGVDVILIDGEYDTMRTLGFSLTGRNNRLQAS